MFLMYLKNLWANWAQGLGGVLKTAGYHYNERNYSLPYELLVKKVKL